MLALLIWLPGCMPSDKSEANSIEPDPQLTYKNYQPTENDFEISRADYHNRLYGFWLGQCIANWTGLVTEMDKLYSPKTIEEKWQQFWEENQLSHAEPVNGKETYSIVIPPPNVTDILHVGHALNNTIQDILIRFKRMQGYVTEWMPGTDHAGRGSRSMPGYR